MKTEDLSTNCCKFYSFEFGKALVTDYTRKDEYTWRLEYTLSLSPF